MITSTGYNRRTYEDILNAKIAKAKELFGEEINTDGNTALGKFIRINAYDQYYVEQEAEQIYYSIFPQTASGQSLDRLGWVVGISRNVATPAQYKVSVTGSAGATVEYGFLVATDAGLNFYNTRETVIGEDGKCEIEVECTEAGTVGNVAASTINKVVNPVAYVETVAGTSVVEAGADAESDYDFIKRFEVVREGKGGCSEGSLLAALASIPTVHGVHINVNESVNTVDGVPPKSVACYLDGGKDYAQEIGETIFEKKPIGIGTYGDQSVSVSYGALKDYEIRFSYATVIDAYIKVELITNSEFKEDGNATIKANIQKYIEQLGIGKPLVVTALYGQLYSVEGVEYAVLEASTDGKNYSISQIAVNPNERFALKQITINGVTV